MLSNIGPFNLIAAACLTLVLGVFLLETRPQRPVENHYQISVSVPAPANAGKAAPSDRSADDPRLSSSTPPGDEDDGDDSDDGDGGLDNTEPGDSYLI